MHIFSHVGQTKKLFGYAKHLLNEILKIKPPLVENESYDNEFRAALLKFKFLYNTHHREKKLIYHDGLDNETWAAIGVMLGADRLKEEIASLKDPILIKLLQGIPLVVIPPYTAELASCDKKIAEIFGDLGAAATGSGFEPPDASGKRQYRGGEGGHLSDRAMHLYGDNEGSKVTGVYIPKGFEKPIYKNPRTLPEYKGGSFVAYYKILGNVSGVSLIITHLANFTKDSSKANNAGSIYIGETGGKGGEANPKGKYMHSHFEIVKGRVTATQSTIAMEHYSFMSVFCK